MVCMLTLSQRLVILFGGIGAMVLMEPMDGVGIADGAGIVLTILGDIIPDPGEAGMTATGVAGMAVVAGDIITGILDTVEEAIGLVTVTQIVVRLL